MQAKNPKQWWSLVVLLHIHKTHLQILWVYSIKGVSMCLWRGFWSALSACMCVWGSQPFSLMPLRKGERLPNRGALKWKWWRGQAVIKSTESGGGLSRGRPVETNTLTRKLQQQETRESPNNDTGQQFDGHVNNHDWNEGYQLHQDHCYS